MLVTQFKQFLGVLVAFLALVSCEAVSVQANLNVTPKTVSAPPEGGSYTVAFTAGVAWETSTSADWIHISPASGESGDITITITVDPNPTTEPRSAGVQVTAPEHKVTETVAVSQEGKPAPPAATLSLSAESSTRPYSAGSAIITVNSNRDWTAESNADWLTVDPSSGEAGQTQVTMTALENTTDQPRSAAITFKAEDLVKTYTLTQEAQPSASIELSSGTQLFAAQGGEYTMIVNSNRPWTSSNDSQWVSVSPSSGDAGSTMITVKALSNEEYENRNATIEFTAGDAKATLVITQLAAQKDPDAYVRISTEELTFPSDGGSFSVIVSSNQAWVSTPDNNWVSVNPREGIAGISEVVITVDANTAESDRVATIAFTAGSASANLIVFQKAYVPVEYPMLDISTKAITLPAEASQSSFTIMTNRDWSVSVQADWLHLDQTSGTAGNIPVKISADSNPNEIERTARIVVTSVSGLTVAVTVTQQAKEPEQEPQLELSALSLSFTEEGGSGQVTVISDTPWRATCQANWLSFAPASGNAGTTPVQIAVQPNNTSADRNAEIIFAAGSTTVRFTVNQKAKDQQGMGGITGEVLPWDDGGQTGFHQE